VNDEPHNHSLEPRVLEGQLLSAAELEPDAAARRRARDGEHLLGRIDAPGPCSPLGQGRGECAGPAADVEDPAPDEVALCDEELDQLPPTLVERPQPVVVPGERPEVRRVRR